MQVGWASRWYGDMTKSNDNVQRQTRNRPARRVYRRRSVATAHRTARAAGHRAASARSRDARSRGPLGPARTRAAHGRALRQSSGQPLAGLGCGRGPRPRAGAAAHGETAMKGREAGRLDADVCVIGAGAGGAVIAAELAEGGMSVVVLEEGQWHDPDAFTARMPEMLARLYRDGGQIVTLGKPPIMLPLGRGVGGTTLINSGTCFRTPAHVLERWQREFGMDVSEQSLQPCFERVEQALSVSEVTPELAGGNAEVARRGAERLGWSHGYLRRNARGCVGSGVCTLGCPTSAKQHTGITYIPRAQRAGARILTGRSEERRV